MIPFFDTFVDTREKRYHLLILMLLVSSFLVVLPYILIGFQLLTLDTTDDVYAFLRNDYIEWTFVSRLLLDVLSIPHVNVASLFECFIKNIALFEGIVMVLFMFSYGIIEQKKISIYCLVGMILEVIGCMIFASNALFAGSLLTVIVNLQRMGMIICFVNTILCIVLLGYIVRQIRYYRYALSFDTEEIKEHIAIKQ